MAINMAVNIHALVWGILDKRINYGRGMTNQRFATCAQPIRIATMTITGKATVKGTQEHATIFNNLSFSNFGSTNLKVSQVGFGSYRVNLGNGTQEQALRFALQMGINLIDTSANYADGGSERLIGRVLTELIESSQLTREELIVVSKAGYLQGSNYVMAEQRKQGGRPFPNLVKYDEGLDHCIHPEFLQDQLTRSLERLNLESLDGFLLHNPEYYLMWAQKAHYVREVARSEYYRRIREAFIYLETEVDNGRIQWYGISSNTFPEKAEHFNHTSLAKIWEIAASINTDHHFRIVQTPLNLLEPAAAIVSNQPDSQTFLQYAATKDLAVLINRPLNAFTDNSLTRLSQTDMPNYLAPAEDVSTTVDTLLQQEAEFEHTILPSLLFESKDQSFLRDTLALGKMLDGRWGGFHSYQNWLDLQSRFLLPRAQAGTEFLSNQENLPAEANLWLDEYIEAINIMFAAVSAYYQEQAANQCTQIRQIVQTINPTWEAATLSQTAVRALRATKGVTCVLVGMRHQNYVQDIVTDLGHSVAKETSKSAWVALAEKFRS